MRKIFLKPSVIGATCLLLMLGAVVSATQAAPPPSETQRAGNDTPVDLNKATVDRLTEIPGIGNVTAGKIVAWRDKNGPFRRVEDLMKVKGIGEKSFEKIRPHVKVSKSR